jgi:hypothetical protein
MAKRFTFFLIGLGIYFLQSISEKGILHRQDQVNLFFLQAEKIFFKNQLRINLLRRSTVNITSNFV